MTEQGLILSIQSAGEQIERERARARRPKQQSMFADEGGLFAVKPKAKPPPRSSTSDSKGVIFEQGDRARIDFSKLATSLKPVLRSQGVQDQDSVTVGQRVTVASKRVKVTHPKAGDLYFDAEVLGGAGLF